jgi:hypothetical protein
MPHTITAGSVNTGDLIVDPRDGITRRVVHRVGAAPLVGLFLRDLDATPDALDRLRTFTLTDTVTLTD